MPDRETDGGDAASRPNPQRPARFPVRDARLSSAKRTHLPRRASLTLRSWSGIAWFLFLPAISGCLADRASFSLGLSTTEIVGAIELDESDDSGPPLILVYKHHYMFTGMEPEVEVTPGVDPGMKLTRPSANLAAIGSDGTFTITVPNDVVAIDAFFFAPNRLTDEFRFHKQVGIGRIVYRPNMPRMSDWRSHFYTYIAPELDHVIVERRYDMPAHDQATLSAWLLDQRKRLESRRKPQADS